MHITYTYIQLPLIRIAIGTEKPSYFHSLYWCCPIRHQLLPLWSDRQVPTSWRHLCWGYLRIAQNEKYESWAPLMLSPHTPLWKKHILGHFYSYPDPVVWTKFEIKTIQHVVRQGTQIFWYMQFWQAFPNLVLELQCNLVTLNNC